MRTYPLEVGRVRVGGGHEDNVGLDQQRCRVREEVDREQRNDDEADGNVEDLVVRRNERPGRLVEDGGHQEDRVSEILGPLHESVHERGGNRAGEEEERDEQVRGLSRNLPTLVHRAQERPRRLRLDAEVVVARVRRGGRGGAAGPLSARGASSSLSALDCNDNVESWEEIEPLLSRVSNEMGDWSVMMNGIVLDDARG